MKQLQALILGLAVMLLAVPAAAQQIVNWQQFGGELELGYPVPIPVDTPLPFDGFRSYSGLFARHQQLMNDTNLVHGSIIGQTHANRDIWAYRLGDSDQETIFGQAEPAMFLNGGIHAREWQSPETVTGVMELLASKAEDNHLYRYLLDNVNPVVIPVLNVDGFLQTQRFPRSNWLGTDPRFEDTSPRDGRMRRKNMRGVDEILTTRSDHLTGVDLNRNNPPFWGTNPDINLSTPDDLIYSGTAPHSEPETQAMAGAAEQLGPGSELRMFSDLHSFSQVHFPVANRNSPVNFVTNSLLNAFSNHHEAFPADKRYVSISDGDGPNLGTGFTTEFFGSTYDIPSWTLEIEPSGNAEQDGYGGSSSNGHSGFILPDSEIRRVREQLAETFAVTFYHQAGPPTLIAARVIDPTDHAFERPFAVVFDGAWDVVPDSGSRQQHSLQTADLELGREYQLWLAFDKPMRARDAQGNVTSLQGLTGSSLTPSWELRIGDQTLELDKDGADWLDTPGRAPLGYLNYRDDAVSIPFTILDNAANRNILEGGTMATLSVETRDMVRLRLDADPATIVTWDAGWANYDRTSLPANKINGGADRSHQINISTETVPPAFTIERGISAAWFTPGADGEGFVIQVLADSRAVMYWFSYDDEGNQRWFIGGDGEVRGNRILFDKLFQPSGGEFGPDTDLETVDLNPSGSATFLWEDCDRGTVEYRLGNETGRLPVQRLSVAASAGCDEGPPLPVITPPFEPLISRLTGSWFTPDSSGEGFALQVLLRGENEPLESLVYWFSYGPEGDQRWYLGVGSITETDNDRFLLDIDMVTTRRNGGDAEVLPWGDTTFELSCESGTMSYDSNESGFGSGSQPVTRLSNLEGLDCPES